MPWLPGAYAAYANWNPDEDVWRLYKLDEDYSQSRDISPDYPQKLEELKQKFDREARANHVYPIGAGLGPLSESQRTGWNDSDRMAFQHRDYPSARILRAESASTQQ